LVGSRGGLVSINISDQATDLATGVRFSVGVGVSFLFATASRTVLGTTQPPIKWAAGVKRPGREADYSPSCSIEVMNAWSYISTSKHVFMA